MPVSKKVRWIGAGIIVALLLWKIDLKQMGAGLRQIDWRWGLLALVTYGLVQVISSRRWQMLARPLGFPHRLNEFVSFYFIGMFFNLILPTTVGGDVIRGWYLDGRSGRRWPALLSVFAERVNGLAVLVALACLGATLVELPAWMKWWVWSSASAFLLGLLVLAILARLEGRSIPALWRHKGDGAPHWPAAIEKCLVVLRLYISRPRLLARVTLLSVVVQVVNVVVVWMLGHALGVEISFAYWLVVVPLVTLLTLLPVSVNGMGLREGGLILLLAPLGVSEASAVTLGLLWFVVLTLSSLGGAFFYLFGRFPRYEVVADDEPVGGDSDQGRARQPATAT